MKTNVGLILLAVWVVALTIIVGKLLLDQGQGLGPLEIVKKNNTLVVAPEVTVEGQLASLSAEINALELQLMHLSSSSSSQSMQITQNNNQTTQTTQTSTSVTTPSTTAVAVSPPREFILPLGSGSTDNRDWTPITAASVEFNPAKYQPLRKVRFEAAGSIISGEVHVLLTDITHNITYYNAELVFNSSTPAWQRSAPITLANSPSQLQVQILSTNGEMAILNDSRLVVEVGY